MNQKKGDVVKKKRCGAVVVAHKGPIAKDMQRQVEAWVQDHTTEINAHGKQERVLALTAGARESQYCTTQSSRCYRVFPYSTT